MVVWMRKDGVSGEERWWFAWGDLGAKMVV
jgi:hypothetical protein